MSEIKTNEEIFDEMFEEITRLENGIATKDAELARLREATEIGVKWMEWWLAETECECECAHTCGRTERYEELLKMREAL